MSLGKETMIFGLLQDVGDSVRQAGQEMGRLVSPACAVALRHQDEVELLGASPGERWLVRGCSYVTHETTDGKPGSGRGLACNAASCPCSLKDDREGLGLLPWQGLARQHPWCSQFSWC